MGSGHPPLTDRLNHTPPTPHHHHHHFTSWLRNQKGLLLVLTKSLPEARAPPPTLQGQAAPSGTGPVTSGLTAPGWSVSQVS